jgi:hypothetical protein
MLALLNMAPSAGLATSSRRSTSAASGDRRQRSVPATPMATIALSVTLTSPFIPTRFFPSYSSANASTSYAGRSILERVWGGGLSLDRAEPSLAARNCSTTRA